MLCSYFCHSLRLYLSSNIFCTNISTISTKTFSLLFKHKINYINQHLKLYLDHLHLILKTSIINIIPKIASAPQYKRVTTSNNSYAISVSKKIFIFLQFILTQLIYRSYFIQLFHQIQMHVSRTLSSKYKAILNSIFTTDYLLHHSHSYHIHLLFLFLFSTQYTQTSKNITH